MKIEDCTISNLFASKVYQIRHRMRMKDWHSLKTKNKSFAQSFLKNHDFVSKSRKVFESAVESVWNAIIFKSSFFRPVFGFLKKNIHFEFIRALYNAYQGVFGTNKFSKTHFQTDLAQSILVVAACFVYFEF